MNTGLAIFLFIHGLAHIVGFMVYFRIITSKDMQYSTSIFPGNMNVGDAGMRFIGFVYLMTAFALGFMGYDLLSGNGTYFREYIWTVTMVSTAVTLTGWPDTKYGVLANVLLILFLALEEQFHWLSL